MRLRNKLFATIGILLTVTSSLTAVDMLYVSMGDNTIVSYDTTSNDGNTIAGTKSMFTNTNLNSPTGLAFDSSGSLYVANYNSNTISKFDSDGFFLSSIGDNRNLNNPIRLAFDSLGNLYASNFGHATGDMITLDSSISKFNSSGVYHSIINSNLNGAWGIAFDSSDNFYVANAGNSTISKYDSSGVYQIAGSISSHLTHPMGLAFDQSGNLYNTNRVNNTSLEHFSKFDSSGTWLEDINSYWNTPSRHAVAFDSSGNLYGLDMWACAISKYDSSGNFITSWNTTTWNTSWVVPLDFAFRPNIITIPEPSTYALATIASGVLAYLARQKRQST